jgi:uncharacterized protein
MILYIHGFGSCGFGTKASIIRKSLDSYNILAPTLSYVPNLAIDTLCQIIESFQKYETIYLIGSSLGGYYSIYLAEKYDLKAVLINPSIKPIETLSKVLGQALNYGDLSKFEWNEEHIQMLQKYQINTPTPSKYLLLTQTGDELLDYTVALNYLKDSKQIVVKGGDHSFINFENYIDEIINFFDLKDKK